MRAQTRLLSTLAIAAGLIVTGCAGSTDTGLSPDAQRVYDFLTDSQFADVYCDLALEPSGASQLADVVQTETGATFALIDRQEVVAATTAFASWCEDQPA